MTLRVENRRSSSEISPAPENLASPTMSRSRRSWVSRRAAPILLFLIGCLALGYYAYDILDARVFQDNQSRQFDQALREAHDKAVTDLNAEVTADLNSRTPRANTTAVMPNFSEMGGTRSPQRSAIENMPLGRIEINSIGLTAMIQEGTADQTLQRGVGHIAGTASLGAVGNIGLAAHRDTFFRKLKNIHEGDEITLTTLAGSNKYRVELISIVEPQDSAVLRDTGGNILTLVTCYPFSYIGPAPKRFIVRAKQEPSTASTVPPFRQNARK
jgi:LPXTG-site transpeptidase (sortase) family protein